MRSDYVLYIVAIACFIVASFTITQSGDTQLYSYAVAVIGMVFVGLGYIARPKESVISMVTPVSTTSKPAKLSPKENTPKAETVEKPKRKTARKETSARKTTAKKRTTRRRRKKA